MQKLLGHASLLATQAYLDVEVSDLASMPQRAIRAAERYTRSVMATTATTVYSQVTKDPHVRGGKACIEGTRVAVADTVFLYRRGYTPERIQEEYPQLNLAQVHAALSYYHARQDEIESEIHEDESFTEELDRQWEEYVQRHGGHPPDEPAPEDRHIAKPVGWRPKE